MKSSLAPSSKHTSVPFSKHTAGPSYEHSHNPSNKHSSSPTSELSSAPSKRHSLAPSKIKSQTPSSTRSSAPTNLSSLAPTHTSPTKSPVSTPSPTLVTSTDQTSVGDAFTIGSPDVEYVQNEYKIKVVQGIGKLPDAVYKPDTVNIAIYDETCRPPVIGTNFVTTANHTFEVITPFHDMTGTFGYEINIDISGIVASNPLVTFDDAQNSKGEIKFCAVVTNAYEGVEIKFQKTIFVLGFDVSSVGFNLGNLTISELDPETEEESNILTIGVDACVCNSLYVCLPGVIPTVKQNDDIMICLTPESKYTGIKNFALSFKNQEDNYLYQAVDIGADKWVANVPTIVSQLSSTIMITTIMVAGLFDNKNVGVLVEGVAQLEFFDEGDMRSVSLHNFQMMVDVEMQEDAGCVGGVLDAMLSVFK